MFKILSYVQIGLMVSILWQTTGGIGLTRPDWFSQQVRRQYKSDIPLLPSLFSPIVKMLRVPFPSTGTENITLFRGGKRARRDALKDGLSLSRQSHRSPF